MNQPGFSAEASLGRTVGRYRAAGPPAATGRGVAPAGRIDQGCLHECLASDANADCHAGCNDLIGWAKGACHRDCNKECARACGGR